MPILWQWSFLGNSLRTWVYALLVGGSALVAFWAVQRVLLPRLLRVALKAANGLDGCDQAVERKTKAWLPAILAAYAGSLVLTLPPKVAAWAGAIALTVLLVQLALWADAGIGFWLKRYQKLHEGGDGAGNMSAVVFVSRLVLYSVVALLALDNLPNVQVTSLIASLGVGGIAVALAVQNVLVDLLASLSIAFDQPFVVGDYIVVDNYSGTVEHVGLKTTRVRSLSGEQLIFSNNDLLKSRIRNYKRMQERRVAFTIGVTRETPYEKLERIPGMIKGIVEVQAQTRFERAHFASFGDFSLSFETVYYMLDPNYGLYMDTQQAINLALIKRLAEEGIELAYPTQTLHESKG